MKKRKLIFLMLSLICASALTACNNEHIIGPQGPQGETGERGEDGVSIVSVDLTSSDGLVDIYTITYSDGTTSNFIVTNGKNGEQGIQGIPGQDGHTPVITISSDGYWVIDGVKTNTKAQGEQGEPGKDGTSLLTGNGEPSANLGKNGDSYIDLDTWDFYVKTSGTWIHTGNIKGEQGNQGNDGIDGLDGTAVLTGEGEPSVGTGKNGDSYIDLSTWNYYVKENDEWVLKGNIKGTDGTDGEDGNGIVSIELTSSSGNIDTYTITFDNGETTTFTVTNGEDGEQGIQGEPGEDGHTPIITIGENGNWYIDGEDTGVLAEGVQGPQGEPGKDGSSLLTGKGHPSDILGKNGDSYIDLDTWDFYVKTEETWNHVGNIKGEQGEQGYQGNAGASIYTGDGVPESNFGKDGDYYIRLDTWDFYYKFNGSWLCYGNIKGKEGDSAYEIYKKYHPEYVGSEEQWLSDLINGKLADKVEINFNTNGGWLSSSYTLEINKGTTLGEQLPIPTNTGRKFLGWYTGWSDSDQQIDANTIINDDLNLIAMWDKYDVLFLNYDGTAFATSTVEHGSKVNVPDGIPYKPTDNEYSYIFDGWDFDFNDSINSNIMVYPKWKKANSTVSTISIGEYPQSVVSNDQLKEELSNLENGKVSGSILSYDSNGDKIKEKYLVQETKNQVRADDGSKIEIGLNYFLFEPIEWRVISQDDSTYSLITDKVIDAKKWTANKYVYEDPYTYERIESWSNYAHSDIREWLNNNFYNLAFDDADKGRIETTLVDNSPESSLYKGEKHSCEDTTDNIYLLSLKEATSLLFQNEEERITKATDLAKCMIDYNGLSTDRSTYGNAAWYLRSPDDSLDNIAYNIQTNGFYGTNFGTDYSYGGIRPAMCIKK